MSQNTYVKAICLCCVIGVAFWVYVWRADIGYALFRFLYHAIGADAQISEKNFAGFLISLFTGIAGGYIAYRFCMKNKAK
jgi:hypothetical protein